MIMVLQSDEKPFLRKYTARQSMVGSSSHSQRGISYIISVLIMTLVTLSLASTVLFWSFGQVAESQSVFTSAINARIARAQERIVIENVKFTSGTQLTVYVRNVGAIGVVVDAVYVNQQAATVSSKVSLAIQTSGGVTATVSGITLTSGTTYTIAVATTRGTVNVGTFTY